MGRGLLNRLLKNAVMRNNQGGHEKAAHTGDIVGKSKTCVSCRKRLFEVSGGSPDVRVWPYIVNGESIPCPRSEQQTA